MSSGAAFDSKERVKQAIDVVDLVGSYLELRRQGRNYVALCPWHDDTRPSLQVNPDRQTWKCWVCDVGGDVFNFVMQRENIGFREALVMLAERAGIELEPMGGRRSEAGSADDKQTLYKAAAWAEQQYHQCLLHSPDAEPARRYLADRGISQDTIGRFHLGFAPDSWQWILDRARSTPFSPAVLEATGLVAKSPNSGRLYDRFKGRLLFSIRDTQGRPIALGGRVLPELARENAAKYINSPETMLFSKSDQLYGLDVARGAIAKSRQVVVVEGYTDSLMAAQQGLSNVVAVLGTSLTQRHIRLLRRFADSITLVLDGDEAGQRRTNEILELFVAEQVDLRILTLPEGLDPCDFLLEKGADAFRELLDGAIDALEHRIRTATRGMDSRTSMHGANQALEAILSTLAKAPRLQSGTTMSLRLREQQVLARLAREFQVAEAEIRDRLRELRRSAQRKESRIAAEDRPESVSAATLDAKTIELIEILILNPELIGRAEEAIPGDHLPEGPAQEIYSIFCRLYVAGEEADFGRVLTELEDSTLKSLLVQLDESAHAKAAMTDEDASTRLDGVIRRFHDRQSQRERLAQIAALEQGQFANETDEMEALERLIQQKRDRQGISAPTDG